MGCSPGDDGYWMGQTEVTVEAYKRHVRATGKSMPDEPGYADKNLNPGWRSDDLPITMVSWTDAQDFCEWAGGLRLPREAEWEYAARAGSTAARYSALDDIAWYGDNSGNAKLDAAQVLKEDAGNYGKRIMANGKRPHAVGQEQANGFQLSDMLGSVWEWTGDWLKDTYYKESPSEDPQGPPGGELRVLRGGSWGNGSRFTRASHRVDNRPSVRFSYIGFRCVGEKLVLDSFFFYLYSVIFRGLTERGSKFRAATPHGEFFSHSVGKLQLTQSFTFAVPLGGLPFGQPTTSHYNQSQYRPSSPLNPTSP